MKLKLTKSVKVRPKSPFNFDATFHKPAHFASADNFWQTGIRWQTFWWRNESLGVKFINIGSIQKPLVKIDIWSKKKLTEDFITSFIKEIRYRYNFDLDLKDFYKKFSKDKFLAPAIKRIYGMRPGHQNSLYEYLIIGIVLQNCVVRRSIQMMQALYENYGTPLEFDNREHWCFWQPGSLVKVKEEELRSLKIGYRAKSIKKVDDYFAKGLMDEFKLRKEDKETQMAELLKLYGVGPATVWYLLFDVFHHYDFFNHISPWEQKVYSKLFFDREPENPVPVEKLINYFGQYGEYKQLAVHYIWDDLWWKRKNEHIPWLEKLIRV